MSEHDTFAPQDAYPFKGAAVVTGAGSGIGRALAHGLVRRGLDAALIDVNPERLDAVAGELASNERKVTTHALDVSDREAVAALPAEVARHHGQVSMLFNNAGVALGGRFDQVTEEDFDWLMEINFGAVVRMTRAFLPALKAAPQAQIVNISSIFGVIAPAGQAAYSASKFAVRGFSEALRHETAGTALGVTVVHPGGIATRIAEDARMTGALAEGMTEAEIKAMKAASNKSLVMPPEKAATQILDAAAARKGRLLIGLDARVAALIQQLAPVRYYGLLKRRLLAADSP